MFKNKLANIGYWMIMAAGVSMIAGNWLDFDFTIINGVVAGIGFGLMMFGMYKGDEMKQDG